MEPTHRARIVYRGAIWEPKFATGNTGTVSTPTGAARAAASASGLFPMTVRRVDRSPPSSASLSDECRESIFPAASRRFEAAEFKLSRKPLRLSRALPAPSDAVDVAVSSEERTDDRDVCAEERVAARESSCGFRLVS